MFNYIKSVSLDEYEESKTVDYKSPIKKTNSNTIKVAISKVSADEDDFVDKNGKRNRKRKINSRSIENKNIPIFNWKLTSNESSAIPTIFPEFHFPISIKDTIITDNKSIYFPNTILSELKSNSNNDANKINNTNTNTNEIKNNKEVSMFFSNISNVQEKSTSIYPINTFNSPVLKKNLINSNICNKQRKTLFNQIERSEIENLNLSLFSNNDSNIYIDNSINNHSIFQNSEEINDNIYSNFDDDHDNDYENKNELEINTLICDMNTMETVERIYYPDISSFSYNQIENEINTTNRNVISDDEIDFRDEEIDFQTPTYIISSQPILRSLNYDSNQNHRTTMIDNDIEVRFNLNDEI